MIKLKPRVFTKEFDHKELWWSQVKRYVFNHNAGKAPDKIFVAIDGKQEELTPDKYNEKIKYRNLDPFNFELAMNKFGLGKKEYKIKLTLIFK